LSNFLTQKPTNLPSLREMPPATARQRVLIKIKPSIFKGGTPATAGEVGFEQPKFPSCQRGGRPACIPPLREASAGRGRLKINVSLYVKERFRGILNEGRWV